jgi:hypothetical protein
MPKSGTGINSPDTTSGSSIPMRVVTTLLHLAVSPPQHSVSVSIMCIYNKLTGQLETFPEMPFCLRKSLKKMLTHPRSRYKVK